MEKIGLSATDCKKARILYRLDPKRSKCCSSFDCCHDSYLLPSIIKFRMDTYFWGIKFGGKTRYVCCGIMDAIESTRDKKIYRKSNDIYFKERNWKG